MYPHSTQFATQLWTSCALSRTCGRVRQMSPARANYVPNMDIHVPIGYSSAMSIKRPPLALKVEGSEHPRPVQFVQLEAAAIVPFDDLLHRSAAAGRLLLRLIGLLKPGTAGVVVVSRYALAEMLRVNLKTVQRSINLLAQEGWVQRMKVGSAWALAVNRRVAWVGPRDGRQQAAFSAELATVVLARSEQDALALDPPPMKLVPTAQVNELVQMIGEPTPPAQDLLPGVEPPVVRVPAEEPPPAGRQAKRKARAKKR